MHEMLKTLAIGVESQVSQQEIDELARQAQEAQDKKIWIIILCVFLAIEIIAAVVLPKYIKKYNERKAEKDFRKAERKRIQSKR